MPIGDKEVQAASAGIDGRSSVGPASSKKREAYGAWALPATSKAEPWAISRRYGGVKRCS